MERAGGDNWMCESKMQMAGRLDLEEELRAGL